MRAALGYCLVAAVVVIAVIALIAPISRCVVAPRPRDIEPIAHHEVARAASVAIAPQLPPTPPMRRHTYRVAGAVLVAGTTTACPEAEVTLTDADGRDTRATLYAGIESVEVSPGQYLVDVSCKDYQSADHYASIVVTDHDVVGLVWPVTRGATIAGRVVSSSGEVVPDASVAVALVGVDTPVQTSGWGREISDTAGRFAISGLAPGVYHVAIESSIGMPPVDGFRVAVVDQVVERDFILDPTASVDGVLEDVDGNKIARTEVYARAARWSRIVTTDTEGRFHLIARAGDITLLAQRPGRDWFVSSDRGDRFTVAVGSNSVSLIVAARTAELHGDVIDEHGRPQGGVTVSAIAERATDMRDEARSATNGVTTDDAGRFTIEGLDDGPYTLRVFDADTETFVTHVATGSATTVQFR